jgi:O-acetyl-ADP-ribose deacetylase (regulator of RNase III)
MGKGIALSFKERFPDMFFDYKAKCKNGEHVIGEPYLYKPQMPPWIINFPTKIHWKNPSRLEWIVSGLQYLDSHYEEWNLESLAMPMLGCGNGGLSATEVLPIMQDTFAKWKIPVFIFQY